MLALGGLEPPRRPGVPAPVPFSSEGFMDQINRLPNHFPHGTRYVIEGRDGHILLRYLEFPDGRHVDLPTDHTGPAGRLRARRRMRKTAARHRS
jgi:hypothetical protein